MYTFNSDVITVLLGIEKEFGGDITIDELLKMANVDKKGIAEVKFTLRGVYKYAYELTGETFSHTGTISEHFEDFLERCNEEHSDEVVTEVQLHEVLSDEELDLLTDYFFGDRSETYCEYTSASQSQAVTKEEVKEYLKTYIVPNDFKYSYTVTTF